ncbi:MAG: SDR family oxidoreductase [Anaerolineaceae bacterium]|jgi:dihydroflavonol-4-reductase|nr:SDR family oxidoreductase [Anaerolineaceae bacterium]
MILVTGAAGHLGNVLVRELLVQGEQVRGLVLPGEDLTPLEGLDVEIFPGNILDLERMTEACREVDVVFHLASLVAITPDMLDLMRRVNVEGTRNVIEAVRRTGVRRLVYTSSIHALQRPPAGVMIDEHLAFDPNNPAGPYDQTKAEASLLVLDAVRQGMDAVIVCPTGVIGPYDFKRSELGEMILAWMKKAPSFTVEGKFDFVDVRDVAIGHILAAESGRCGEVYLLSGEQIEISQMRNLVQKAAGVKTAEFKLPAAIAALLAPLAEVYYHLSHQKPIFTRYSVETLRSNSLISSRKATEELGYQPRPVAATIEDTVAWWKQNRERTSSVLRGKA